MSTHRDEWRRAAMWALAAGLTAEGAIEAADRRVADKAKIEAAVAERFDEYGLPRREDTEERK